MSPIFIPIRRDHACIDRSRSIAKFSTGSISFESASRLPAGRSQQPLVATLDARKMRDVWRWASQQKEHWHFTSARYGDRPVVL
jgi:hypothetical protein